MKAFLLTVLLSLTSVGAEPVLKWSVSVSQSGGDSGGGRANIIHSSGDITTQVWDTANGTRKSEITGYVNQEELQILSRLLADPNLHKARVDRPATTSKTLEIQYGEIKRKYIVGSSETFPEPVEHLSREVNRALKTAKQDD